MDVLLRLIGLLAVGFTLVMTLFALVAFRKERRIGVLSPLISMVVSLVVLPVFMLVSGARLNLLLALPVMAFGLLAGFLRGQTTRLYYKEGRVVGRHSLFFLLGWGASLALSQLLSLFESTLLASVGLLPLFLSTGTQVGIDGNIFLRRLFMRRPPEAVPIDVARLGLPERGNDATSPGLPERR